MCVLCSVFLNLFLFVKVLVTQSPVCDLPRAASPVRPVLPTAPAQHNHSTDLDYVIFIGGVPRSGTTLVRVMLDSHPDIRCGEETRVIPRIMGMLSKWSSSQREHQRLLEAGLSDRSLDAATKAFISHIITAHGEPSKFLCNKDPLLLSYMLDLHRMYPRAKFLLIVRDGRAVAYSIVSRNVTISGVNNKNYMSAALFWNRVVTRMVSHCQQLGEGVCMRVQYEDLVRIPKYWMEKILEFLRIPWHNNVLHHHELINKEVSLSKYVCVWGGVRVPLDILYTHTERSPVCV